MPMGKYKGVVHVIDDELDVRDGLGRLLRSDGWDVDSFDGAQDYLNNASGDGAGCILLDLSMPHDDRFGAARHIACPGLLPSCDLSNRLRHAIHRGGQNRSKRGSLAQAALS
jgi:CheY-like chemotaxis protein